MTKNIFTFGSAVLLGSVLVLQSGCVGVAGPTVGIASIPVPIGPYYQQIAEDHGFEKERYNKVIIMPPITEEPHIALDPPPDDLVIRQLEKARPLGGSMPLLETTMRNIRGITKELVADYVDPPRVMPLVGPVQLHHAHYKCTVYFEEITHVGWPIPHQIKNEDGVETLFIDCDHLHRVGGGNPSTPAM
ncbi:MAG: hypothetical protein LBH00_10465 [Planctomycetaceae bacterium]|nr:hypothetical protein [Planctomycetaceae bacterium]